MRCDRRWQDAGTERGLRLGETYDVPDLVAQAFLATGAAEREEEEAAIRRSPETKPTAPTETKRGRA